MAQRVDVALHAAGLATSRTHARRIVEEGRARINDRAALKASEPVQSHEHLSVVNAPTGGEWVSRGALKLAGLLEGYIDDPHGREALRERFHLPPLWHALDVGASTGGFTDVLVRAGAHRVSAVDVGRGQLAPRLAHHPRVRNYEGTDARALTRSMLGRVDVVVSDASFISLRLLVEPIAALIEPGVSALLLVKPQFEVGKSRLGKSGIVSEPRLWVEALTKVGEAAARAALTLDDVHPSSITGQDGNREFFAIMHKQARPAQMTRGQYVMIEERVRDFTATRLRTSGTQRTRGQGA